MSCDFVTQLGKLRKLSMESVENTYQFNDYKRYLHIERPVEAELRNLIKNINAKKSKCLVLLCGSAGDGKSHLLSYFSNVDSEKLLAGYVMHNDASESKAPNLTSIDTLTEKLEPFSDENYMNDDGTKMILAINLGTLNNFIESENGKRFTALKKYVELQEIFSSSIYGTEYKEDSVFQHISFSDYQIFTLKESGAGTEYLERLFVNVFRKSEENPFYRSYTGSCMDYCPKHQRCPIKHNFEFLTDGSYQLAVIRRLVEVVVKDKAIVSTREVLNFIYDILVHPDFSYAALCNSTGDTTYLTDYISYTTPMLLYEYSDISPLLNIIRQHDLLKERKAELDAEAMRFHSIDNIEDAFAAATEDTPYALLRAFTNISVLGGTKPDLKQKVFRFIVRTKELKGSYQSRDDRQLFTDYLKCLYYLNSGQEKKLSKLYDAAKKAVLGWDGTFEEDYICIDDSNEKFWVLEQLKLKASTYQHPASGETEILRFSPVLKLRYKTDGGSEEQSAEISVDYSLFEMIFAMRQGYRPTVQDKNRHTDFVSFVQQLVEFGNKHDRIIMISKDDRDGKKFVFEETDFGYEFRVV